jgi:hypothetical protein
MYLTINVMILVMHLKYLYSLVYILLELQILTF